jgi:hypothetical protein
VSDPNTIPVLNLTYEDLSRLAGIPPLDDDLAAAGDDLRTLIETDLVIDDCPHPFEPAEEDLA